jgi:RHS repeat-associated protein
MVTDYVGGFEYSNSTLQHFAMSEGRVIAGAGTYQYFLKDHLGNVRMTITPGAANSDKIVQQDFYYPFGMRQAIKMPGLGNKKLYNGKELVDQNGLNWYHYGARWYDPVLCKWTTMDPADELHSPYCYVGNNPVFIIDPTGKQSISAFDLDPFTYLNRAGDDLVQQSREVGDAIVNSVSSLSSNVSLIAENVSLAGKYSGYIYGGLGALAACAGQPEFAIPLFEASMSSFAVMQYADATNLGAKLININSYQTKEGQSDLVKSSAEAFIGQTLSTVFKIGEPVLNKMAVDATAQSSIQPVIKGAETAATDAFTSLLFGQGKKP